MKRVLQRINEAFHDLMENNKDVLFIGEDVLDPYGGAFKVAKGLSDRFPDQVITTPIKLSYHRWTGNRSPFGRFSASECTN